MNIEDKINEYKKQKEQLEKQLQVVNSNINSAIEEQRMKSDNWVKCKCIKCKGMGYVILVDKKVRCNVCSGLKYLWCEKY
jgi:hypothetical protein